jgi:CubicO group peptidase (beta-lactamase class C family)
VLAHVLERATDRSLPELLSQQIFNPLGMCDTAFSVADSERNRLLPMYGMRDLDEPMPADPPAHVLRPMDVESGYPSKPAANFVRGGHGLFSTVDDYCRFMPVLLAGKAADGQALLSAPMVNMMWQNRIPQNQRPLQIGPNVLPGYGWNLFGRVMLDTGESMKLTAAGEGGWAGAASTHFWVDRELQMTGVVMAQFLGSGVGLGDEMQTAAYQCFMTP